MNKKNLKTLPAVRERELKTFPLGNIGEREFPLMPAASTANSANTDITAKKIITANTANTAIRVNTAKIENTANTAKDVLQPKKSQYLHKIYIILMDQMGRP